MWVLLVVVGLLCAGGLAAGALLLVRKSSPQPERPAEGAMAEPEPLAATEETVQSGQAEASEAQAVLKAESIAAAAADVEPEPALAATADVEPEPAVAATEAEPAPEPVAATAAPEPAAAIAAEAVVAARADAAVEPAVTAEPETAAATEVEPAPVAGADLAIIALAAVGPEPDPSPALPIRVEPVAGEQPLDDTAALDAVSALKQRLAALGRDQGLGGSRGAAAEEPPARPSRGGFLEAARLRMEGKKRGGTPCGTGARPDDKA